MNKSPNAPLANSAKLAAEPGPAMVFLDDWHDGEHVYGELLTYCKISHLCKRDG